MTMRSRPEPEVEQRRFTESFFVDRDYYVQTITNIDDTVLVFSRDHPGTSIPPSALELA